MNPYIGTISHMLTSTKPEVLYPYGMARSAPVVDDCGDYYCNDRIRGFASAMRTSCRPAPDARKFEDFR